MYTKVFHFKVCVYARDNHFFLLNLASPMLKYLIHEVNETLLCDEKQCKQDHFKSADFQQGSSLLPHC